MVLTLFYNRPFIADKFEAVDILIKEFPDGHVSDIFLTDEL